MSVSLLVLMLCAGDYACDEAGRAYAAQPAVKAVLRTWKGAAIEAVGPELVSLAPMAGGLIRSHFNARVWGPVRLEASQDKVRLVFKYSF